MPRKTRDFRLGGIERHAASMRPRPDAAENPSGRTIRYRVGPASMRPRPDAAENGAGAAVRRPVLAGFNEAAARCRGKRSRSWVYQRIQLLLQ